MSDCLQSHGLWLTRLLCPWDFPGKNTGVGGHSLLQRFFPTQGSNPQSPALAGRFFTAEPPGKPYVKRTSRKPLEVKEGELFHESGMR